MIATGNRRTVPETAFWRLRNVLPRLGVLVPANQPTTQYLQPTQAIYKIQRFGHDPELLVLMGKTKAWAWSFTIGGVATLVEITPTSPFTNLTPIWKGATLVQNGAPVFVVTNFGEDYPHSYAGTLSTTKFIPVTNAPKCRTFCGWLDRMMCGGIWDEVSSSWLSNQLQWSSDGDITDWTSYTAGFLPIADEADPIYNLEKTSADILCIFRRRSVYLGMPYQNYENPIGAYFKDSHGIYAPNTLQRTGDIFFYLGDNDVYQFDSDNGAQSIGIPIRLRLFYNLDTANILYSWSYVDEQNKDYYLVVPYADGTWVAWIYNYEQKSWTSQDFSNYLTLGAWHS